MWNVKHIDDELCRELLCVYSDDPLISVIDPDDAYALFKDAILATEPPATQPLENIKNETTTDDLTPMVIELIGDYLSNTKPEEIALPSLLLKGSMRLTFSSNNYSSLSGVISAPLFAYFEPFAADVYLHPVMMPNPDSTGVLFHPARFQEIAYRNPRMFDCVVKDRNRMMALLLKWTSIYTVTSPGDKIARYLLAIIPDRCEPIEVIHKKQGDIANELDISRATIAKGISYLYNKNIISTGHGKLHVNTASLKDYVKSYKQHVVES